MRPGCPAATVSSATETEMGATVNSSRISILAGLAAALACAAPAAADIRTFKVTAEGSGTYERRDDSRSPTLGLGHEESVSAGFSWRVVFPRVAFDSMGGLLGSMAPPEGTIRGGGEADFMGHGMSGDQPVKTPGFCSATDQTVQARSGSLSAITTGPSGGDVGAHLIFRPFDEIAFPAQCTGALANIPRLSVWDGSDPADAFDTAFFLPKEATDQGKIIQLVEQTPAQKAACALAQPWTQSCTLSWSGTLTFDLVDVLKVDPNLAVDELLLPLEPQPTQPAQRGGRMQVPRRASLAPNGSKASVQVTCPAGCSGTVRAYAAGATARSAAAGERAARGARVSTGRSAGRRALAARRFSAKPGRSVKVTLRFRGTARRAVRRAGGVRLVVTAGGVSRTAIARAGR
jgi:hypothetical protein